MIKKLCMILILCVWTSASYAVCLGLSIQNISSTLTYQGGFGEYDSFDTAEYIQTVTFDVHGNTSVLCSYFIGLSSGNSGNASQRYMTLGGQTLNYNAYTDATKSNIFKSASSASSASQVITGTIPSLTSNYVKQHSFVWSIPAGQVKQTTNTRYQDSLNLQIYNGVLGVVFIPTASYGLTVQTKVESSVNVSLRDSGSSFLIGDTVQTMDFGTLTSGELMQFDILVRSNDGYDVKMQSQNSQILKHANAPAVVSTIPYTISVNGVNKNLASGALTNVALSSNVTTSTGTALPVGVTIGTLTGNETAGIYSDYITVTVTAD